MTPQQRGFLLLTSQLGDPRRNPLTTAQLRLLTSRVRQMQDVSADGELTAQDLRNLGYGEEMASHIVSLLEQEDVLTWYLRRGEELGCTALCRIDGAFPMLLQKRLDADCPGCLWAKGDLSVLNRPGIALVGSRNLSQANRDFAQEVGREAARQGLTLISGNAKGADRTAQDACLNAGGWVVSIVADELYQKTPGKNLLFLSETDYDAAFTSQRALSRNRVIHCMGQMVFVAQANYEQGGSWQGAAKNLQNGWSTIACFDDGSKAAQALESRGAYMVTKTDLKDLTSLFQCNAGFFE